MHHPIMLHYAKACAAGVTVADETGLQFIPFWRRAKRPIRRNPPAEMPASMHYHTAPKPLATVLPATFSFADFHHGQRLECGPTNAT